MYILRDTFWANKVIGWGFEKMKKMRKKFCVPMNLETKKK